MKHIANTLAEHIIGFQHVGHIVQDLATSIAEFKRVYGVSDEQIKVLPPFDVVDNVPTRFALIQVADCEFELIQPISEHFKSILWRDPSGSAGINHVAWQVKDIEDAMAKLAQHGVKPGHVTPDGVITMTTTSTTTKKMVYLDPATTGGLLIELIELVNHD